MRPTNKLKISPPAKMVDWYNFFVNTTALLCDNKLFIYRKIVTFCVTYLCRKLLRQKLMSRAVEDEKEVLEKEEEGILPGVAPPVRGSDEDDDEDAEDDEYTDSEEDTGYLLLFSILFRNCFAVMLFSSYFLVPPQSKLSMSAIR